MKIFVSLLISSLLLSGCASNQPATYSDGKVVSCGTVKRADAMSTKATGVELLCLGDESKINFDSLRGPMVLNVWGSWCAPCKDELPFLREFHDKYGDQIQVVGLNVEEANKNAATPFIRANGITWPSLYDPDGRTRKLIGMGVPVTWFIDSEGKIIHKKIGVIMNYQELEDLAIKYFNLQR